MWCFSCFKPSTYVDPFEAETDIALTVSRHEADIQEAAELASAIQESSRLRQLQEEEERRRAKVLEEDAQIANGFLYEERERQIATSKSALEDEQDEQQFAKTVAESLQEKGKREQLKNDEQLALAFQESLNMEPSPPRTEKLKSISRRASLDVDEQFSKESLKEKGKGKKFEDEQVNKDDQFAKAVKESLREKGKGKKFEDAQVKKDEQFAVVFQESLNMEPPPQLEENINNSNRAPLDEDEQLEKVIWESMKGKGLRNQSKDEVEEDANLPNVNPSPSMCGGCNSEIEQGRSVDILGVLWHPECLWCDACHKPIAIHEVEKHVSNSRGKFHKSCYERYCYVCKEKKMKTFNQHHFWEERYCRTHESDKTPRCCSCERLEARGTNYVMLGDGRWLCLECMESAVMDSDECQPLHFDMREFFEGLNMKIEKEFPFLLVEKQALNKAEKEEKIEDNEYEVITRGICLSEAQTVTSVSKKPRMGPHKQLIGMATESQRVVRDCEVTAILILYGLPRLLTGYILAHEMMHAYLRLNGHRNLDKVLEEGICQVLGHMWLESQTYATTDATDAAASSSSTPVTSVSKKGEWSDFEKKLVEFCKNQIETDESPVYGVGFRKVNQMVTNSSLQETLKEITRWG